MRKDRLLHLADHLEFGKLGHDSFDFRYLHIEEIKINDGEIKCGSLGCGLGECPYVFQEWVFRRPDYDTTMRPVLIDTKHIHPETPFIDASRFFELSTEEIEILFLPIGHQSLDMISFHDNGEEETSWLGINGENFYALPVNCTKEDLARNIRKFVELKEKNVAI